MRPKSHNPISPKLLLIIVIIASFILFIFRSMISTSNQIADTSHSQTTNKTNEKCSERLCDKLPVPVSEAIIHYATSTITPQQTLKEISVTSRVLDKKSPCNFLVFGLGHDSLMWHSLNHGGRTLFLEEDGAWIEQIKRRFPMLESHHVTYDTKVSQADALMKSSKSPECTTVSDPRQSQCILALKGLPSDVYDMQWDLIMVDAPTGYYEEAPGRMAAIYTAGMLARNRQESGGESHVFVHDVNREVEDKFSREFLCEGYMKKQQGRLRHFVIPTHRDNLDKPFCPSLEKTT